MGEILGQTNNNWGKERYWRTAIAYLFPSTILLGKGGLLEMLLKFNKSNITKNLRNKFIILLFRFKIFLVQVFEEVIIDHQ